MRTKNRERNAEEKMQDADFSFLKQKYHIYDEIFRGLMRKQLRNAMHKKINIPDISLGNPSGLVVKLVKLFFL